jgi:hypothetical protein
MFRSYDHRQAADSGDYLFSSLKNYCGGRTHNYFEENKAYPKLSATIKHSEPHRPYNTYKLFRRVAV